MFLILSICRIIGRIKVSVGYHNASSFENIERNSVVNWLSTSKRKRLPKKQRNDLKIARPTITLTYLNVYNKRS